MQIKSCNYSEIAIWWGAGDLFTWIYNSLSLDLHCRNVLPYGRRPSFLIWKHLLQCSKVFAFFLLIKITPSIGFRSRRIVAQHQSAIVQLRREKINTKLMKMLLASTFSYLACVLVPLIAGIVGDSDGDFRETAGIYMPLINRLCDF